MADLLDTKDERCPKHLKSAMLIQQKSGNERTENGQNALNKT